MRALEADLDGPVGQMAWSLEANTFEGKRVVGAKLAVFLDEEEFVIGLVGWEETDAVAVQAEAV